MRRRCSASSGPSPTSFGRWISKAPRVGNGGGSVVGARRSQPLSDRPARDLDDESRAVREQLESAFSECGVPEAMLMDHGTPWWNANAPTGATWLTVWLMRQGIELLWSGYRHPQTQGKWNVFMCLVPRHGLHFVPTHPLHFWDRTHPPANAPRPWSVGWRDRVRGSRCGSDTPAPAPQF